MNPQRRPDGEDATADRVQSPEFGWADVLRLLNRRRGIAVATFLLVLAAFGAYFLLATPVYDATARLLIDPESPHVVSFEEVVEPNAAKLDYYQTQRGILRSRMLARRTLDTLRLWDHPAFAPERGLLGRGIAAIEQAARSLRGTPAMPPTERERQSRAVDLFLEGLGLSYRADTRLMDVSFRSRDPHLATAIVNTLAQAYIDQYKEFRLQESQQASEWLGARLAEQRARVEASELQLQNYAERHAGSTLPEQQKLIVDRLGNLSAAVARAQTERIEAQALYEQIQSIGPDSPALDTLPIILGNPFIRELKANIAELRGLEAKLTERLGDRHPEIVKVRSNIRKAEADLQTEIAKVVESVRLQAIAARAREQGLSAGLGAQKGAAVAGNRRTIEYQVLEREAISNREMFESLLRRASEAAIASELRTSNIRIVDSAEVPVRVAWPRVLPLGLLALLTAVPLALIVPLVLAFLDGSIRTPDDVARHLRVPLLALVPFAGKARSASPLQAGKWPPELAESFRTLRSNVLQCRGFGRSLVVTSARPGEGKSLVASQLAIAFARIGRRVLLIDADMRAPRQHAWLGCALSPGFAEVVRDGAVNGAFRQTSMPGLTVMPAGRVDAAALDVLQANLGRAVSASRERGFDFVIIDSPPVLAVNDAIVLSQGVSGVLFVIEAEATSRRDAAEALDRLRGAGSKVLGVTLNKANLKRHRGDYAPYYRAEYRHYYLPEAS
jgi:capsular exopolysaccharide synthesis family protein